MNPATPATILALAATILLALATCTAPVTQSLYFLEVNVQNRVLKFGTLGYCLGSRCTPASVGYRIDDASSLLGVNAQIPYASQLSSGVVHALTYTLVLHPVACGLAAVSVVFGLLNHCAGFGIGCVGGFFTGFATTVALVAFGLDIGLFTVLKRRIESRGGTASYGNGIWITLAAFICLVLCQIAFCCCCCGSRGGGSRKNRNRKHKDDFHTPHPDASYGDRMRMDALQAEANRNNRNAGGQQDLPKFAEYVTEHEVPLKHDYNDGAYEDSYRYSSGTAAGVGAGAGAAAAAAAAHHHHHQHPQQHAVGQAYGGGPGGVGYDDPYSQQGYGHSAQHTQYVPGVGPAYGDGGGLASSSAYDANNMGGYGAHGYPSSSSYQDPHQQYQDNGTGYAHGHNSNEAASYYPQAATSDYHDGSVPTQAVGGVVGRQPSTYRYTEGAHRSRRTSEASQQYQQSSMSGHGTGHVPMPEPVPALPTEYANGASSSGPTTTRRQATQTQDDGFGLSALQAGAAGAAGAAAAGAGSSSKNPHHYQEPSGMYYDAEEGRRGGQGDDDDDDVDAGHEFGYRPAHGADDAGNSEPSATWQHSSSARGQGDAYSLTDMHAVGGGSRSGGGPSSSHGHEVPSYEVATGQAGLTSPSAMRAAGGYRPLPVPQGGDDAATGAAASSSQWPNEKRH